MRKRFEFAIALVAAVYNSAKNGPFGRFRGIEITSLAGAFFVLCCFVLWTLSRFNGGLFTKEQAVFPKEVRFLLGIVVLWVVFVAERRAAQRNVEFEIIWENGRERDEKRDSKIQEDNDAYRTERGSCAENENPPPLRVRSRHFGSYPRSSATIERATSECLRLRWGAQK